MFGTYFNSQKLLVCMCMYIYINIFINIYIYIFATYRIVWIFVYKWNICCFHRDYIFGGGYYETLFKRYFKNCCLNEDPYSLWVGIETKSTVWRKENNFYVLQGQPKWGHHTILTEAPSLFCILHLRSVIAAIIQPSRVLRGKRTASKHFGGVSWTTLLCFCNLQSIRDMPGLESLRHIGLSGFYDEYNLNAIVGTSITLCMRLQFSEMEGRKWGYYKDEGDLLLFFFHQEKPMLDLKNFFSAWVVGYYLHWEMWTLFERRIWNIFWRNFLSD